MTDLELIKIIEEKTNTLSSNYHKANDILIDSLLDEILESTQELKDQIYRDNN